MSVLVLTEKSSQVNALGKVITLKREGRTSRGVYDGKDVVVFPFSGHIIDIIPLTSRQDDISILPNLPSETALMKKGLIEPEEWESAEAKRSKANNKQTYMAFKKLVGSEDIDRIILATDPDYEGCAIGAEMLEEFNLMHHQINFMNISNIVPKKLKEEFDLALGGKDALNWRAWANVSFVRGEINHCSGIDISHYLMKITGSKTTFGSQQTRGLKLLVNRFLDNKNFDLSKNYRIRATTPIGDFLVDLDEDRLKDKAYVRDIYQAIDGLGSMNITNMEIKKSYAKSPKWYDGSDIGAEMVKVLKKTLKELTNKSGGLLQTMYEQGKMTYPRGEAGGKMPTSQFEEQGLIAKALAEHYGADKLNVALKKSYLWREDDETGKGEIVNHTPCTIASSEINLSTLTSDEKAVVDMSAKMLLSCFYPDNKVVTTTIKCEADGVSFKHSTSTDEDLGWKELYGKEKRTSLVPDDLVNGDRVSINEIKFEEYVKDPPPLFTEATFVTEMKKRKIGAESTFPTHVANILDPKRGYAEKKGNFLLPTEKGLKFIELVPDSVINILSVFEEMVFKDLESGKMPLAQALMGRYKIIKQSFDSMKEAIDDNPALIEAIKGEGSNGKKSIRVGNCPLCQADVVDKGGNSKTYTCVERKGKMVDGTWVPEGCTYQTWKINDNKAFKYTLGIKEIEKLLNGEETKVKVLWKEKDKTADTILKMDLDSEEDAEISFIMGN